MYDLIITVSDMHHPYSHPDVIAYLKAVKAKYWAKAKRPCVVIGGDEIDGHSWSFHDADPDLMSPGDELQTAINRLQPVFKIFPKAFVLESNHGSLFYRKLKSHGLPRHILKSYRNILGAPKGWDWVPELTLTLSTKMPVYFCHGKTANILQLSQSMGMSCVQFHFHEKFSIQYWANSLGLYWAAQAGCLINDSELAYSYNKLNIRRPLIGTTVIVNGFPVLEPMVLNKKGRWVGELYG